MIVVTGIGKMTESADARLTKSRDRGPQSTAKTARDGLQISQEAQEALKAKELVEESKEESEIRQERVEAARQRIEEGSYKVQEVVANVAARIVPYMAS